MPCYWEGNRRPAVTRAMHHILKWFIHLWAQGLRKEDVHPNCTPLRSMKPFTFTGKPGDVLHKGSLNGCCCNSHTTDLSTELEVRHDDGNLWARDDDDDEDDEEESKQVVVLVLPDWLQTTASSHIISSTSSTPPLCTRVSQFLLLVPELTFHDKWHMFLPVLYSGFHLGV